MRAVAAFVLQECWFTACIVHTSLVYTIRWPCVEKTLLKSIDKVDCFSQTRLRSCWFYCFICAVLLVLPGFTNINKISVLLHAQKWDINIELKNAHVCFYFLFSLIKCALFTYLVGTWCRKVCIIRKCATNDRFT